jgi:hypothetical protein
VVCGVWCVSGLRKDMTGRHSWNGRKGQLASQKELEPDSGLSGLSLSREGTTQVWSGRKRRCPPSLWEW